MLYLALLFLMLAFDRASAGPVGAVVIAGLAGLAVWWGSRRGKVSKTGVAAEA